MEKYIRDKYLEEYLQEIANILRVYFRPSDHRIYFYTKLKRLANKLPDINVVFPRLHHAQRKDEIPEKVLNQLFVLKKKINQLMLQHEQVYYAINLFSRLI